MRRLGSLQLRALDENDLSGFRVDQGTRVQAVQVTVSKTSSSLSVGSSVTGQLPEHARMSIQGSHSYIRATSEERQMMKPPRGRKHTE
jgi:hypothetical protein